MSDNLSSFMNLPRLEQLFGQLMARLAHQETEIAALQTAARHNATLEARCAGLEAQLARLEAATSLDAESVGETASEAPSSSSAPAATPVPHHHHHHVPLNRQVADNAAAIARLADLIDGRHAHHSTRHDHALESHRTLTERLDALELRGAAKDHALALEDGLAAFGRRPELLGLRSAVAWGFLPLEVATESYLKTRVPASGAFHMYFKTDNVMFHANAGAGHKKAREIKQDKVDGMRKHYAANAAKDACLRHACW